MDGFPVPTNLKLVQFLQVVCFLSCCSSHAVCLWSAKSSAQADRASASVCSALLFTSTHLLHHSELSSSHLQQPLTCAFLVFQVSWVQYLCRALAQYAAVVCYQHWCGHTANWVNVVTNHSLSSKCRSCHVQCCQPPPLCSLKNCTIPLPVHVTKGIAA